MFVLSSYHTVCLKAYLCVPNLRQLFPSTDRRYMTGLFPVFIGFGLVSVLGGSLDVSLEMCESIMRSICSVQVPF